MARMSQERRVLALYFLTDLTIYWFAMTIVLFARLDTLAQVDFQMLQRDRLVCTLVFVTAATISGCYARFRLTDPFDSCYYILVALAAAGIAQFTLLSLLPLALPRAISRREVLLSGVVATLLLGAWRWRVTKFLTRLPSFHRFFYVTGDEEEGKPIAKEIGENMAVLSDAQYVDFPALKESCGQVDGGPGGGARGSSPYSIASNNNRQVEDASAGVPGILETLDWIRHLD